MDKFDDVLLERFINGFYGYGNLNAPYWFIGMEEGGGDSFEEVQKRLMTWQERGEKVTEDLVEYHQAIGVTQHIGENPPLQPTWSKLIRVLHNLKGKPAGKNDLRRTQAQAFGCSDGTSCLLELLPLPSPSTNKWLYKKKSDLPYLKDRTLYRQRVMPGRIENLKTMVAQYRPQTVLFYGLNYQDHWQAISEQTLIDQGIEKFRTLKGHNEHTVFVVAPHPTSHGITNNYFDQVSEIMR